MKSSQGHLVALVLAVSVFASCSEGPPQPLGVDAEGVMQGAPGQPSLDSALAVHRRHTMQLVDLPGVVGTAVGLGANGRTAIKIFAETAGLAALPIELEGIPVEVHVTGKVSALPARGGAVANACQINCTPASQWPTPVPAGVSTGNDQYCESGTIGARVLSSGTIYALSNNHVFAAQNRVPVGADILQPGLFDTGCATSGTTAIGTLFAFAPISFCAGSVCPNNTIDAAIVTSDASRLGNWTPPFGYGVPNHVLRAPSLALTVRKYGRTTGQTNGTITGIDATVDVGYTTGVARFVHQIVVSTCSGVCAKPGDSGSLWVTNDASKNPVGLLFAGNQSNSVSWANPIDSVLSYFGAVTVDDSPTPTASGSVTPTCGDTGCYSITQVTAAGNTLTVRDGFGNTSTITLSGATASGGLTSFYITGITASGGNTITVRGASGETGTITLSGAKASGGLNTPCTEGGCAPIYAIMSTGTNWITVTEQTVGQYGHLRLFF